MISALIHGASNIVLNGSVLFDDGLDPTEIILDSSGWRVLLHPADLPPVQVQGLAKAAVLPWLTGQLRAMGLTEALDHVDIWKHMGILEALVAEFGRAGVLQDQS